MKFPYQTICLILVFCERSSSEIKLEEANEIRNIVKSWADELSKELGRLTVLARRERTKESFSQANVVAEDWDTVLKDLAETIRVMMREKVEAVKAIKKHAELLSLHRKPPINLNSSFQFYNTDDLYGTTTSLETEEDALEKDVMFKCSVPKNSGLCYETNVQADEPYESFDSMNQEYDSFNYKRSVNGPVPIRIKPRCEHIMFIKHPENYTKYMEMEYDPHFDTEVNLNHSIIKVTPGVHNRSTKVINGIRMSEALDLTFKCNRDKDPTLTYQYFGSKLGYMRFYPAIKWSEEEYEKTFDFRLRSWYIESMSSAKDILILLDRSGSMTGENRNMSTEVVNTILDTLTDNDYVNIFTFTNSTEALVPCFNDSLVQANEENLRLLREQLPFITNKFVGNISIAFKTAFPTLWNYRKARRGALVCNQAIMIITEGLDYEYDIALFDKYNHIPSEKDYRPIRIFTYLLGSELNDAQRLKWIACNNMGYYVNITTHSDVREKVLKYLEVMSRPINLSPEIEPDPAWTALYVHLVDRRLSNLLWKKNVGNRQRQILLNYGRMEIEKDNKIIEENQTHFTLGEDSVQEQYEYKYLTSVSLPVYDFRTNKSELLGVAGVDVPLDYIKQLTEPHRIGVNGYPFIITNNGYVLDHPDHRTVFESKDKILKTKILKPTFNRVDFTEVEISDNTIEPRKFDSAIIEKRVMLQTRHYYYTTIDPFSLIIALPDKYGFNIIKHPKTKTFPANIVEGLKRNRFWKVHPKWMYTCNKIHKKHKSPERELLYFLKYVESPPKGCNLALIKALVTDVMVTEWFIDESVFKSFRSQYPQYKDGLVLTFLATHAGLTRWTKLKKVDDSDRDFATNHNEAADEVYYRRSAELNYDYPNMFLYSVPFEDYDENNTIITASNVIFQANTDKRAPVAAVGFQIYHKTINAILNNFKCTSKTCKISCVDGTWTCYVVDNDGYIILAKDTNLVSKSLREIDPRLMHHLVQDEVFKEITLFDYQDICFVNYTYYNPLKPLYGPTTAEEVEVGLRECAKKEAEAKEKKKTLEAVDYRIYIKCKTFAYLNQRVQKAIPTPCDNELRMYNTLWKSISKLTGRTKQKNCTCPYITEQIQGTNLMLVAVEGKCCAEEYAKKNSTIPQFPQEINYNLTLPCYIATMNNFTKRHYMKCTIQNDKESKLEQNHEYCGGKGIDPIP